MRTVHRGHGILSKGIHLSGIRFRLPGVQVMTLNNVTFNRYDFGVIIGLSSPIQSDAQEFGSRNKRMHFCMPLIPAN